MDKHGQLLLRLAVGIYVGYLAVKLFISQQGGSSGMSPSFGYAATAVLFIGACLVCAYGLREFLRQKKSDSTEEN